MSKARKINFEQAVYDAFGQVKDFTLAMRIARYFYEKAEKDTIERAVEWLENKWREYVWTTDNGIPHFGHWENDFRKAMEEE